MVTPSIRLQRELGRGGMGSVWIAEHLRLHMQVVVKFMAPEYASNREAMMRFEREATLAAQAKSPHVVQVFDHGVSQFGLPYIAMELLEGEDLAKRIEKQGPVPPLMFANWLSQACRGLSRAHGKGIVHRDIKPENIFLCDNDGEVLVKVLDFGIAKADPASGFSGTQTGALLGTAYYMSPEQTMGQKDLDHRSDLWAMGVVAYYALTAVRPFDGDAIGALVMAITSSEIVPPSAHHSALPSTIDAWMARALARPRELRFQSAKEMAEAFQQAVGAGSGAAMSLPPGSLPASSGAVGGAVAVRTAPPAFRDSTMAPSVRPDANGSGARKSAAAPLFIALGALALALLGGAAWGIAHFVAAPAAASAAPSTAPSLAAIAPSAPILAAQPEASTPPPEVPSAAAAQPVTSAAAAQPPVVAAAKPGPHGPTAVAPTARITPAPARVTAAPAAPSAKPAVVAPKAAATPANPLKMKME